MLTFCLFCSFCFERRIKQNTVFPYNITYNWTQTNLRPSGQKEKKPPSRKFAEIQQHNRNFRHFRRCHLAFWPSLIWFSSACSLHSVCLPPVPVENMYHTEQETSWTSDTTPSAHAGSNLCFPFPVLACNQCLRHTSYWFKCPVIS